MKQDNVFVSYVRPINCTERKIQLRISIQMASKPSWALGDKIEYKVVKQPSGQCFSDVDLDNAIVVSEGTLLDKLQSSRHQYVDMKIINDPLVEIRATGTDGVSSLKLTLCG